MSLYKNMNFAKNTSATTTVMNTSEIPKEMDIFYRKITAFLPEGKKLEDLSPKERKEIENRYRFDPLRPGQYQGITGMKGMV